MSGGIFSGEKVLISMDYHYKKELVTRNKLMITFSLTMK